MQNCRNCVRTARHRWRNSAIRTAGMGFGTHTAATGQPSIPADPHRKTAHSSSTTARRCVAATQADLRGHTPNRPQIKVPGTSRILGDPNRPQMPA